MKNMKKINVKDLAKVLKVGGWIVAGMPAIWALGNLLSLSALVSCVLFIAVLTISFLDRNWLKKAGKDVKKIEIWWCLLPPVYLFKRAKLLGGKLTAVWIWSGLFAIGLIFALISGGNNPAAQFNAQCMQGLRSDAPVEIAQRYCDCMTELAARVNFIPEVLANPQLQQHCARVAMRLQ
ncbi:MAG: hypothetical protein FWE17_00585 [Alphaproteobacteria bacterium]|nr:hypothetical protein [Alphaproteobacteria bacterium]MCL2758416.1 hypothetical protein [Alphaproteobacteria bacterium]